MKYLNRNHHRGQSLLEVLAVLAITGIIALTLGKLFSGAFKSKRALEGDVEFIAVKQNLISNLNCSKTLTTNVLTQCSPPKPAPTYIPLYNNSGTLITAPIVTDRASPFNGAGQVGNYYLKAWCDAVGKTITIDVAKANPGGATVATDPVSGVAMDFNNPRLNPVYGPTAGSAPHNIPLCQTSFGGFTPTCGSSGLGYYVASVNFADQTYTCSTVPGTGVCNNGQLVKTIDWGNESVTCAVPSSCSVTGQYATGFNSSGATICSDPLAGGSQPNCGSTNYINSVNFATKSYTCGTSPISNAACSSGQIIASVNFANGGSVGCGFLSTNGCGSGTFATQIINGNLICQSQVATSVGQEGQCSATNGNVAFGILNNTLECGAPLHNQTAQGNVAVCGVGYYAFGVDAYGGVACAPLPTPGSPTNYALVSSTMFWGAVDNSQSPPAGPTNPAVGNPTPLSTVCNTMPLQAGQTAYRFGGVAFCPPGFVAVGGGGICSNVGTLGGTLLDQATTANAAVVNCCVRTSNPPTLSEVVPVPNNVIVTCLRR